MNGAHDVRAPLVLGASPCALLGSGVAFPRTAVDTPTLLARLMPGVPDARRGALAAHFADELGVAARAHLAPDEDPLSLAVTACEAALDEAGARPVALVLATSTATRWTTAESARVAQRLGLTLALCDVRSGCTGGLWALVEGARLARDAGEPVLVVGADSFSRAFAPRERLLPLAMGDGAGAVVVAPTTAERGHEGLVRAVLGGVPALVDAATVSASLPPRGDEAFVLSGDPEPFAHAAEAALLAATQAVRARGAPATSLLVPHVGRLASARRLAATTGLATFVDGFVAHGNLGAASLLVALHRLRARGERGDVILASAGGGLSFGAAHWHLGGAR